MTAAANIECSSFIYGYSNLSRTRYTASTSMYAPEFTTAIENSQGCMEGGGGFWGFRKPSLVYYKNICHSIRLKLAMPLATCSNNMH